MTHHLATAKAVRKNKKRTLLNKSRKSKVKTFTKKLELNINNAAKEETVSNFRLVQSEMMKAVSKGVLKKNTASRKISRLAKKIKNRFIES